MKSILEIFSAASEFEELRINEKDEVFLQPLLDFLTYPITPINNSIAVSCIKTNILL